MSIHKSLYIGGALASSRSVFTRRERIEKLMEKGDFEEGQSVYGLPKVRTQYKVLSTKQLKALNAARTEEEAALEADASESTDE